MEVFYENKVQDLTNLCFLCLTCDKKRTVHNYNYQKIQEELISIFPEQMVNMSKVPKHVCSKCTKILNNCYIFRKKCIKNINSFNELAQKLIQKSDSIVSNEIHNNVESTNTEPPYCNKTIDTSIIKYEPDETCSVDSYTDPLMINCGESTYSDFYSTLVKVEESEDNDNIKQNIEEIVWVKNEIKDEIEVPNVTENLPDTFENVSLDYNVRKTNSEDITPGPSTKRKKVDIKSNDLTISTEHNLHVDRTQSTSDNQSSIKRIRRNTKLHDFYIIEDTNIIRNKIATCMLCKTEGKIITLKMKNRNTSGLKRHLQAKHWKKFNSIFPGCSNTSPSASTSLKGMNQQSLVSKFHEAEGNKDGDVFNQEEFHELLIYFIVSKYLPFNFFDDESCSNLFLYLNKKAILPERNTLRDKILQKFNKMQQILKNKLTENSSRVSFTIDSWTSISNNLYYGMTCHFVDNSWKMQSFALDFILSKRNHDGEYMAMLFSNVLRDYNITEKLQGVTTDNASVNFTFMRHLKTIIGPDFDSENRHFICFVHVLNLAVQDLMKIINVDYRVDDSDLLTDEEEYSSDEDLDSLAVDHSQTKFVTKTRILLKKIKKSEEQQNKFSTCCDQVNLKSSSPVIDRKTRWNSTFEMLSWVVKYKIPLNILCDSNRDLAQYRNDEQTWNLIQRILRYLRPFKTLSEKLEGETYCALSMVIVGINLLIDKLEMWAFELNDQINIDDTDRRIIMALSGARDKILKHYEKTNWIYCVALLLDPRHKKEAFSLTNWGKELERTAVKKFEQHFKDNYFVTKITVSDTCPNSEEGNFSIFNDDDLNFGQIFNQSKQEASFTSEWKQELDHYFSTKRADENTNILDWWSKHENTFPMLSKMAKDIFSVTATSVLSERLFSKASLIIRKHRNLPNAESARRLICLNSWNSITDKKER